MASSEAANPFARWDLADLRRRNTLKWRAYPPDVLPLWVAEMDTVQAEPITKALTAALARGDTGYPYGTDYAEAFAEFAATRWGWSVAVSSVRPVNDVMTGIAEVLRTLTDPGGPVIITPPVYPPFRFCIEHIGRAVVPAQLGADGRLDFGTLEEAFDRSSWATGRPALLLSSPHNPTGVVHSRAELVRVAELADRYGVRVVVDEIHAALTYPEVSFVPYLTVPGSQTAVTVTSGAKAFNLAGIKAALILPGEAAAAALASMSTLVEHTAAALGMVAHAAAFWFGTGWLAEHLAALDENRVLLGKLLAEQLPDVGHRPPEASYLAWLDCRNLGLDAEPADLFLERAKVALMAGATFGAGGEGFVRLNFATAPSVLAAAVAQLAGVVGTA